MVEEIGGKVYCLMCSKCLGLIRAAMLKNGVAHLCKKCQGEIRAWKKCFETVEKGKKSAADFGSGRPDFLKDIFSVFNDGEKKVKK